MMKASTRAGEFLRCLCLLVWSVFVYSKLAPPCMSQLGLKYNVSQSSLTFYLEVSDGTADNVKLNSLQAWMPSNINDSFLEINISQPVLLTALQVQGDPQMTGRVTGWRLETSLECDHYHSENYSIDSGRQLDTETVLLQKMEFVTCIRLIPTQFTGQSPALRLELLGCAVYDNTRCCQDVQPATELWIDGGGCQVNYDREVVLSWVKVLLEMQASSEDNVTIAASLTCQHWHYLNTSDMNVISVSSDDQRSRWLTVELDTPVRARCLRIYPPRAAKLTEVQTSDCGSRFTSSLVELDADSKTDSLHKDEEMTSFVTTNTTSIDTTPVEPKITASKETTSGTTTQTISRKTTETATVHTTSIQTTATSSTTTPLTQGTQVTEKYVSPSKQTETTVTTEQYTLATSESNDNGSGITQTHFSSNINNSTIATNLLNTTSLYNIISTTATTVDKTTTTEIITGINISAENSVTVSTSHPSGSNDSTPIVNESTASTTESTLNDLFKNNTITSMVPPQSSDLPQADESVTETSKGKENNGTECGVKTEVPGVRIKRVIGGHLNSPGQWPWLVSLHFLKEFDFTRKSGFKHTCGATLVAPGWVITAAHCFSDALLDGLSNLTIWRVHFGLHDLAKATSDPYVQQRLIDSVYLYPSYNITEEPLLYDLALVKLNETVEINDRVSPICLDGHTDLHDEETVCYVSGWGQTTLESPGSRYPYTAAMATMTLSKCKEMYGRLPDDHEIKQYARIDFPVLCAAVGTDGQDACQGDSGGPLMCERGGRWYQAGIVAGGYLCGHQATPGLYTRIAHYSKWIIDTMALHDD